MSAAARGLWEVRQYLVRPDKIGEYVGLCTASAGARARLAPGFSGFFVSELGGVLNQVTHFYHYPCYDSRDEARAAMTKDGEWCEFLDKSKPMLQSQAADVFIEAADCMQAAGVEGHAKDFRAEGAGGGALYELRTYQLDLGYDAIPSLRKHMVAGLPSKVAADAEGRAQLAFMGWTDAGPLNKFVELWRYDTMQDTIRVREAARTAAAWRKAVADIAPSVQSFTTQFVKPASFSPWA